MNQLTVTLDHPTPFDGILRDCLTLKAPLVRDMRCAVKQAPQDMEERELILFGLLAEVSPEELEGLYFTEYRRLQESYFHLARLDPQSLNLLMKRLARERHFQSSEIERLALEEALWWLEE